MGLNGLFPGLERLLVGVALLLVLLAYRPLKGWWVWWMWAAGFVVPDVGVAADAVGAAAAGEGGDGGDS